MAEDVEDEEWFMDLEIFGDEAYYWLETYVDYVADDVEMEGPVMQRLSENTNDMFTRHLWCFKMPAL